MGGGFGSWIKGLFGGAGATAPRAADSNAVDAALRAARQPAVALVRAFPVVHPVASGSWFGGLPWAPPSFTWPRLPDVGGAVPLSFMAQIDCAMLPDFEHRHLLPADGALLFFIDLADHRPAVVHLRGPTDDWVRHPLPQDAPLLFDPVAQDAAWWIGYAPDPGLHLPRAFPQWPVRMGAIQTFVEPGPFGSATAADAEYRRRSLDAHWFSVTDAFGPVPLPPETLPDSPLPWRPFEGFPQSWQAVEWFAGTLLHEIEATMSRWGNRPLDPYWKSVADEARRRVVEARAHPTMAAPDAADRTRFWAWLDDIVVRAPAALPGRPETAGLRTVNTALETAASRSAEASLLHGPSTAATIPAGFVERLRPRHHPLRRTGGHPALESQLRHQMLGVPLTVEERPPSPDHLLLLQLHWDPAMMWFFGDLGLYQFWISADDLRAGRFDRVTLVFGLH